MLSVVICTYNEEKNLPRVVNSVKSVADEIIVVDTQSTDKTVDVAKKLGCKVFRHKNTGIIEPVRNFAVSKATGDWILLLDADEELSGDLIREIQQIKKSPRADYYRIPRQNIIFGKWIQSSHWWPDYAYRLYKKGSVVWQDKIHSLPQITGTGQDLKHHIIHHNYQSVSQYLHKLDTYTDFQSQELIKAGLAFNWKDLLTKPFAEFLSQLFARKGLSDGIHGLALAGLQAYSEFVVYLKIWEYHHFMSKDLNLNEITDVTSSFRKDFHWWKVDYQIKTAGIVKRLWLKIKRRLL